MEFGSEYVFCYESSEDETVPEETFRKKMRKRRHSSESTSSSSSDEGATRREGDYERSYSVMATPMRQPDELAKQLSTISSQSIQRAATPDVTQKRFGFVTPVRERGQQDVSQSCSQKRKKPKTDKLKKQKEATSKIISQYFPELRKNISFGAIFPYLVQNDLIDSEEMEMMTLPTFTPTNKVDRVLLKLHTRGPDSMPKFISALRDSSSGTDHIRVADMLEADWKKVFHSKKMLKFDDGRSMQGDRGSAGITVRRADPNIVALQFNKLLEPKDVHTGDPVFCGNTKCTAALSHLSCTSYAAGMTIWICEFCGTRNLVEVTKEEIPTEEDIAYLLTPPPLGQEATPSTGSCVIVFCMDISGSMGITSEVPGVFSTKEQERLRSLITQYGVDPKTQMQKQGVTYVSRLESAKAAVDKQLTDLGQGSSSHRVSLITFADDVHVIGDGTGEEVIVAGDRLHDSDALISIASSLQTPQAIGRTQQLLQKKLFDLEEGGQTALGPALLMSVIQAGKTPGSKVIICTDGLANIGVGSLDGLKEDTAFEDGQKFYQDLSMIAADKGVTVSLVTIKGTECRILELGQVASNTGGKITAVDPATLAQNIKSIIEDPVIATNVTTKLILHDQLYIRHDEKQERVLFVQRGNVKADIEVTYEYGVLRGKQGRAPPIIRDGKAYLPIQLRMEYTAVDGACIMRVFTRALPVTNNRQTAENSMNMAIVGSHALRTAAAHASEGRFAEARLTAITSEKLLRQARDAGEFQGATYDTVMETLISLENALYQKQQSLNTLSQISSQEAKPAPQMTSQQAEQGLMRSYLRSQATPGGPSRRAAGVSTPTPSPCFSSQTPSGVIRRQRQAVDDETARHFIGVSKVTSPTLTPK